MIQRALHRGIESPGGSDSALVITTIDGKGSWNTSEPAYHYEEDCPGRGGYLTLHSLCWRSSAQELTEWITLKQAVNDGTWEVDLIATPDGMENDEQQSSSRWTLLIVRPTQSGARLEGLRRSEAAARQQIHAPSSRAQTY